MTFKTLNNLVESFIVQTLKPADGPAFNEVEKFNSIDDYKDAIQQCRKAGYKVEPTMEDGTLLYLVYSNDDQHLGTFNDKTQEFFYECDLQEDVDTLCDKVDTAQTQLKDLIDIIVAHKQNVQEELVDDIELINDWIKRLGFEDVMAPGITEYRKDDRKIIMEDEKVIYEGNGLRKEFPIHNDLDIQKAFQTIEKLENTLTESFKYIVEYNYEDEVAQGLARNQYQVVANSEEEAIQKAKDYNEKHGLPGDNYRVNPNGKEYTNDVLIEDLDVEDNGKETTEDTLTANGNEYKVLKTKAGMKNWIYKNVKYDGIFKDEYWEGYRTILEQIKKLGYQVISGPANDPHHNNGYSLDGKEKAWDICIESKEGLQIFGQIKAQAAGTVEDPMSAYDMLLILY